MHPTSRFVHKIADYSIWIVRAVVDDYTMRQVRLRRRVVSGSWFMVSGYAFYRAPRDETTHQKPETPFGWKKSNVPAV